MANLDKSALDRSQMDTSQIGLSADRSAILDQLQGIQAIIDPDNQHVTLVSIGDANGNKAFKLKTRIRIANNDASFLQDVNELDASRDASYLGGDIFDHTSQRQNTTSKNIFGSQNYSASPPTRTNALPIPPTPVMGGGKNFFGDVDNSFSGNAHAIDNNTSLMDQGGNMIQNAEPRDNFNTSLLGLDFGNMIRS